MDKTDFDYPWGILAKEWEDFVKKHDLGEECIPKGDDHVYPAIMRVAAGIARYIERQA